MSDLTVDQKKEFSEINNLITTNWLNCKMFTSKGKIEDHAAVIGVSPIRLQDFCDKVLGKPFKIFLTDVRLEYGIRLMYYHNISSNSAASLSGYEDDSNFRKLYKDRFDLSPSQDIIQMKDYLGENVKTTGILEKMRHRLKYPDYSNVPDGEDVVDFYFKKKGREIILDRNKFPLLNIEY